jgi:cytochrome P450
VSETFPAPSPTPVVVRGKGPLDLWRTLRNNPPEGFRRIAQSGDLVVARIGPRNLLVVSHPQYIEAVLVHQHAAFVKGRGLRMARHVLGNGLLTSEGSLWRRQRQLAQPAFSRVRVNAYGPMMTALAEQQVNAWRPGQSLDLAREMTRLTLSIATTTLFGVDVGDRADQVREDLTFLMRDVNRRIRGLLPWPAWWPSRAGRARRHAVARLDTLIFGIIEDRRRSADPGDDLLGRLMSVVDDSGSGMTATQLRDEVMTLFLAGHETTANALAWTFYLLACHPTAAERLAAELEHVLNGRAVGVEDVAKLPYTTAVIQEAMRLYPPAWILVRQSIRPFRLGHQEWPADTHVVMSQWVTHRDPRFWEHADEFRPERWLDGGPHVPPFAYFPFGGGPRLCIGRPFALLEATLLLATIARRARFTLRPDPPVQAEALITLRPRYGIPVTVTSVRPS